MRIAVAEIIHESNTFAPNITSLSQFRLLKAQQFEKFYSGAHSHCTGFLTALLNLAMRLYPSSALMAVQVAPSLVMRTNGL